MDDEAVRVAVGLRLGCNLCEISAYAGTMLTGLAGMVFHVR